MAKTIVISGASYADVALDTVHIISESVPCTGITLSNSAPTFAQVGDTVTITAALTPANTTDTLVWTSSNENVASVENGTITIHGIGTATITATCGSASATASIAQTSIKPAGGTKIVEGYYPESGYGTIRVNSVSGQCTIGQEYVAEETDIHLLYGASRGSVQAIRVPYGATKAKIKTSDSVAITMNFCLLGDTTNMVTVAGVGDFPAFVSQTTSVNSETGLSCSYGQCVVLRLTSWGTAEYVYFE